MGSSNPLKDISKSIDKVVKGVGDTAGKAVNDTLSTISKAGSDVVKLNKDIEREAGEVYHFVNGEKARQAQKEAKKQESKAKKNHKKRMAELDKSNIAEIAAADNKILVSHAGRQSLGTSSFLGDNSNLFKKRLLGE